MYHRFLKINWKCVQFIGHITPLSYWKCYLNNRSTFVETLYVVNLGSKINIWFTKDVVTREKQRCVTRVINQIYRLGDSLDVLLNSHNYSSYQVRQSLRRITICKVLRVQDRTKHLKMLCHLLLFNNCQAMTSKKRTFRMQLLHNNHFS